MQENKRYAPLRPEARPVDYSKLDASQQKAFEKLVGMLAATMEELRTLDAMKRNPAARGLRATPAWLDDELRSRMAFLEGDRGTGKTTVLLSLVRACMGAKQRDTPVAGFEDLRCGRVVFLEPIDMARFPGPANLLAQVLARIEDAIQPFVFRATPERGGRDGHREPRGMLGRCPEGRDPLLLLQRLQTTVATAWDGNLPDRGGQIDPDTYAVEVMNAERRRMTFNVKLSEVVDALATLVPCTDPPGPLFVVSLDDVDLNPLRCLEALKLLHLLAVPRVFTIVLGDIDLVEFALNLRHSGEFSALVGHHACKNVTCALDREVAKRAGELSANVMRKLLPPAQRIRLLSLTQADALNFRPFGMEGDNLPRLHTLLHRCPAAISTDDPPRMWERDIYSLRDFLLYPAPAGLTDETEITEDQLKESTYAASQILRMRPRWAADWWFFLKETDDLYPCLPESQGRPDAKWGKQDKRNEKWKAVIDLLGRHCRSMIAEDPTLIPEDRRRFREGLRRSPASGDWGLSFVVKAMPQAGPGSLLPVSDPDAHYPFGRRIIVRDGLGWRLQAGESHWRPPTTVEPQKLAEDERRFVEQSLWAPMTWGLVVLYDLLSLGPDWQRIGRSFSIFRPLELWGFSEWRIAPTERILVAWPAPGFLSFWGFDTFLSHWNAVLRHINRATPDTTGDSVERCVYAWIDAGAAALLSDKPLWSPETQEAPNWKALVKRLVAEPAPQPETAPRAESAPKVRSVTQIAEQNDRRGYGAAQWLARLAYFLWPAVSGIQKSTAGLFFSNPGLRAFWQKNDRVIEQYVRDILTHPKEKTTKEEPPPVLGAEDAEKLRKDWEEYRTWN